MTRSGRSVMGCPAMIAAAVAALGLTACVEGPAMKGTPAFYQSLSEPAASLDAGAARAMISAYRANKGLHALVLDPALQQLAEAEARAMATADRPSSAEAVKARIGAA